MCSRLVLAVDVFSFSQVRAARDQMVNDLVETATQSAFFRFFEAVVVVLGFWEALILGCDDELPGFCLEASCF